MDKNESLSEEGEQIQASRRSRHPPKTRVKVNKKHVNLRKNNGVIITGFYFGCYMQTMLECMTLN